ncbi:MAG: ribonuclease H-like domain-containing protein [Anaerolineae bacterium]
MSTDLRDKLRRLGVHKGAAKIQPQPRRRSRASALESLIDGRLIDTPHGPTFLHEETYAADHPHGGHALGDVLSLSPAIAAQIGNDPALEKIDLSRVVFLDTETTGLAGGAGTLAFLVGIGTFQPPTSNLQLPTSNSNSNSNFHLHQFFLRSPGEEPAMLHALADLLDSFDAVISFNGRGFDMPLLQSRFTLARMRPRILRAPHLDLLMPARRVWRGRLPSCALSSLERHVLSVQRDQADVPGFLIPEMYLHYVRSGDASEMPRVMYHNAIDILSMVSLSTRLITLFAPLQSPPLAGRPEPDAGDWLALGKWYDDLGRATDAESALRACLVAQPDRVTWTSALHRLGYLLKRLDRREEAARVWEALSESETWEGVEACIELAKHYEWREVNPGRASAWTREAIAIAQMLPDSYARDRLAAELTHRMERLERKR